MNIKKTKQKLPYDHPSDAEKAFEESQHPW